MRRIVVNVILIVLFVLLGIAIVMPFLAGMEFNAGKRLEVKYRWRLADEKFSLAMYFDMLSAEYHAGMGKFYAARAAILKNKVPTLLKAEGEYEKAHTLNPYSVRYIMELAALEIELFLVDTADYGNRRENSVSHFKEAFKKDPYNYIFNYDIGRNFLRVWDYLDKEDRQFALRCFRRCLEIRPGYHWRIYPLLWNKVKDFEAMLQATPAGLKNFKRLYNFLKRNELWEHRKKIVAKLEEYKEREEPEVFAQEKEEKERLLRELQLSRPLAGARGISSDIASSVTMTEGKVAWIGKSTSGENTYRNGNMYWTGTMNTAIDLPDGGAIIKIQAKGSQANDVWPYMIVGLEGEEIGETFVDNFEWKEYSFNVNANGGIKVLSVTFPNDQCVMRGGKREDRNLYVGDVRVE